jgi:hypothetical protein
VQARWTDTTIGGWARERHVPKYEPPTFARRLTEKSACHALAASIFVIMLVAWVASQAF